ncbi:MAG: N-formylglutamate deformylase [Rhodospirillaceae bacterium]
MTPAWLTLAEGNAPLILSMPHTGTALADIEPRLVSPWLARKDADWWIEKLYDFAHALGATIVRTALSRTVIDVNRDPSGASLYPGQATTDLCPTTTFDGEPLYKPGQAPKEAEIAERRALYYDPYHNALGGQITRLHAKHKTVVLYDCHSIRSVVPRLFTGELPNFNIGTNSGKSCAPELEAAVAGACAKTPYSHVVNGRFKGGYITRHYGHPARNVHAVQMELACRGYLKECSGPVAEKDWPVPFDPEFAAPMRAALSQILNACLDFAKNT